MKMRTNILLIDNFDSFTFNLVHLMEQLDVLIRVIRNDALDAVNLDQFTHLVISPGPGLPKDAGQTLKTISRWPEEKPILGVCLGMQALIEFSDGSLENMQEVQHGALSRMEVGAESRLFESLPSIINVGRYHSWACKSGLLPKDYKCTAISEDGYAMAMEHLNLPRFGVQFHPESIMTEHGLEMLKNFVEVV